VLILCTGNSARGQMAEGSLRHFAGDRFEVFAISGAYVRVMCAHLMFGLSVFSASRHSRSGISQIFSEFIATFGLLSVIWGCSRLRSSVVPFAVGAYITAAYWFTASTSFANPAVALARAATDTFTGIRPADVPGFVAAELAGAAAATVLFRWLVPALPGVAPDVLVPHGGDNSRSWQKQK
jgi:glycerol uptake facilitator-like aquaporin